MLTTPIAVLGSGSWGTALAIQFARAGRPTRLWGRNAAQLAEMRTARSNRRYLPDAVFPDLIEVADTLESALAGVSDVLVAVPSSGFRALLTRLAPDLAADTCIAWATKGFERDTGLLPHQIAQSVLGKGRMMAVLSGPTFAREVGAGLPTAMVVASVDETFAMRIAEDLASPGFRTYVSTDIAGVEIGGAVKNVIAVGAGLSDGLGFGANMRVALITRGLSEMTRIGVAMGARERTFMGLAGLGDLVLTCTDDQSRNRRCGLALARGLSVDEAMREIGQVVEGYHAARVLRAVARRLDLDLPVCEGICRILFDGAVPGEVVRELMARPPQAEFE
ncbi:MAG TPA: NAD(P)H-dependent glycerol-3-phosphate dehydrogenase [Steroidobacteraceae bacterium]|nr:NAD(P)H-dependent glycerol-3-phosphate dehydrogenase [Steroidobacteraceae bacterium]